MNRVFNKIILGLFAITLTCNSTIALESEFKNSLVKVDLTKINENTYDITLYTQNKYYEPVKILKKSDLSYYILLPETKNNVTKTSGGPDIRNISTDLYPYAGQDVDNGFTKITINTTKPLNFKISTRSVAAASKIAKNTTEEALALKPKTTTQNSEATQKKNLASSNSKTLTTEKKENKTVQNTQQKTTVKEKPKKVETIKQETETPKKVIAPIKQEIITTPKEDVAINEAVKKEIETVSEKVIEETPVPQEVLVELDENKIIDEDLSSKELISETETKEIEQIVNGSSATNPLANKLSNLETRITKKLNEKGITLTDLFLIFAATILTFIFVFAILTKKNKHNTAKKVSSLDENEMLDSQIIQEGIQDEPKNNGQYFVFDKNIQQTGFCNPATSTIKRNYELSSYEPELKSKYNRGESTTHHSNKEKHLQNDSEYDIIQKILKEDSFIDIPANDYKEAHNALNEAPIVKTTQAKATTKPISEPTVLSSVEVAPERGFMCVSYNDNINLMGYIFDDVFPLYNFKLPKLENYDIKFRLSEKDEKAARFIVKIAGTKMLVKITKSSMNMEVLL